MNPLSYLPIVLLDVHEAGCLHSLSLELFINHQKRPPNLLTPINKKLSPLPQCGLARQGSMITLGINGCLKTLDPATWLAGSICFQKEGAPVGDRPDEKAHMDVVSRVFGEGPRAGAVFYFTGEESVCGLTRCVQEFNTQFEVWRYPCCLNRGNFGADNLRFGIFICKFARTVNVMRRNGINTSLRTSTRDLACKFQPRNMDGGKSVLSLPLPVPISITF